MTHQLGPRDLKSLLNCSLSLVFIFLCDTNQEKALTLDKTLYFHINQVGEKKTISNVLDKAMKNDLTGNNPEEVNDHALEFGVDEDKCT